MSEAEQRVAVTAEARSWLRTPYHHQARIKHAGVDCAMLLAEVYQRAGVVSKIEVGHYPRDWHLHRRDERFLSYIIPHAVEVEAPLPGDAVVYAIGLGFAHAAIIIDPGWPRIIHSDMDARCVTLGDGTQGRHALENSGALRPVRFFSPWGTR